MMDQKKKFRETLLQRRASMSSDLIESGSAAVQKNLKILFASHFTENAFLGGYRTLPGEVDVEPFFRELLDNGDLVCFPRLDGEGLQFVRVMSLESEAFWAKHAWGIWEPKSALPEVEKTAISALIVPLLGVDLAGNRIGFGKGFYDRYLAGFTGWKVGVAFDWQISSDSIPMDEHDVPLDIVVSESDIHFCSSRALRLGEKLR